MASARDVFPNLAAVLLTMSAANTLTFAQILTGVNLGAGIGMLIDKIEWFPAVATLADLDTDSDYFQMAITTSNTLTDLVAVTDRRIVLMDQIERHDFGTAASAMVYRLPMERTFAPPLILASPYLYIAANSSGMTVAGQMRMRLYFRYIELTDKEYMELAEAFILLG